MVSRKNWDSFFLKANRADRRESFAKFEAERAFRKAQNKAENIMLTNSGSKGFEASNNPQFSRQQTMKLTGDGSITGTRAIKIANVHRN